MSVPEPHQPAAAAMICGGDTDLCPDSGCTRCQGVQYHQPFNPFPRNITAGAERDALVAQVQGLAVVVHEADWTMAGPRWTWREATPTQRDDAYRIAGVVLGTPTADSDTLDVLVRAHWSSIPKHGAPRRVEAKVAKIQRWLGEQPDAQPR